MYSQNNRLASITFPLLAGLLIVSTQAAFAAAIFETHSSDGTKVFSDAPVSRDGQTRTSYKTVFGRPTAVKSCQGLKHSQLAERANKFNTEVSSAANKFGVDVDLIKAIAQVESCFDPQAVSRVGAMGLMQLMPATAQQLGVADAFNARQNLHGGADYIARMLKRYDQNHTLALAAYNAGPAAVDKYQGVPPYPETQQYVQKVLDIYTP